MSPCAYTQLEAGADMLPCVSHLPCFLLTSHFRERGESCSLPWSTAPQQVHPGIPEAFRSCQARHHQTSSNDREQQVPGAVGTAILSM